ncbi:uncharacterized protein SPSK_05994 [Sporothrix schenckii 1099-18]|uniref:F5/8 type C domain-containing protein n=2 Tax=Sporothrix schenckii TaxID=29908 RepID=U7PUC1_SPOS1|nr:uncharacterized protein SPSK_05994 [Sporothrix schenckii 1099-18]ERS98526.1 hypothetical protein HMPREF1624_05310 [Sporothrix schenckii ATCC 58251]KJR89311.1 hypothetical protein SPSK_05994 [Sporothrix schenckii 1099-18]
MVAYKWLALVVAGRLAAAWGTASEDITYVLPIYEGALANDSRTNDLAILSGMKSMLGTGGRNTKLGFSFSSWCLSRDVSSAAANYTFDPTNLDYVLGLAAELALPILVHANNGRWADCCTSNSDGGWNDALLDAIAAQPDTTMQNSAGDSLYGHDYGSNYFSFSRYNDYYRSYKRRNLQASMRTIAAWAADHPALFAGISLDSETLYANDAADYNPLFVREWKEWMQHTGLYGAGGAYFGQGRVPAFASVADFNAATGQSFASWDDVAPPAPLRTGDPFTEEWQRWRIQAIVHTTSDETAWIVEAGIPRDLVYGHQTPELEFYAFADDLTTATAALGAGGYTAYGRAPLDFQSIDTPLRADGGNNFGLFELNPLSTDDAFAYDTLTTLWRDGAKILCPNAFENVTAKDQYALFGSPTTGDTWGNNINKFLATYADTARPQQPPGWNPGRKVFDLYDAFATATASGPDNHLAANGSSGGVALKTVYEAVGGVITYTVPLPAVRDGQRLNFYAALGIKDGAGPNGGTATFQAAINGDSLLLGNGIILPPTYWTWKHWLPVLADVTAWAGQTVSFTLSTTGNDVYGWTQWGSPALYQTPAGASGGDTRASNLALHSPVTASSDDRSAPGGGWAVAYLTDGNVRGDAATSNGWSSAAHASSQATEWVAVDLGRQQSVGKVVLHPRSDVSTAAGTGFPVAFVIEGSTGSGNAWTTLSSQPSYGASIKAGRAEVITFPSATVRYVRVTATELSGVGGETGYRMQLAELEVYA